MARAILSTIGLAIEQKAEEVRRLAVPDETLELDRLRDETAALQVLIAEAALMQPREDRFDARGTAVFFPVLIETEEFTGYCLVSDLSAEGMKAKVYAKFSRQQPICIHFTSHETIQGTLVWHEDHHVGIQFDHRIDVAVVLSSLKEMNRGSGRNRAARLPINCLAEITVGDRYQFVEVRDISQRGAKILSNLAKPGQVVAVQLDELEERSATVRWSRSGLIGLTFSKPLSFQELAEFGQSQAVGS
jgi:hypothetical protein